MIVDSLDLIDELKALGFQTVHGPRDYRVFLPSLAWLAKFAPWIKQHCQPSLASKRDCDDQALQTVLDATEALNRNRDLVDCGHAVLYCELTLTLMENLNGLSGGAHATNLVRTPEGWYFLERQTGLYEPAQPALDRGAIGVLRFVWV